MTTRPISQSSLQLPFLLQNFEVLFRKDLPTVERALFIPNLPFTVIVKRKAGQGHTAEQSPASVVKNARPKVWEQMEEPAKRICGLVPSSRGKDYN